MKNTISELYQNLTFETLGGAREIQFEWISDLVLHIICKLQHSILLNTKKKKTQTLKNTTSQLKKNITFMKNQVLTISLKSKLLWTY